MAKDPDQSFYEKTKHVTPDQWGRVAELLMQRTKPTEPAQPPKSPPVGHHPTRGKYKPKTQT